MSFEQDMDRIINTVLRNERALYRNCAAHAFKSIVEGSEVTGAPGQPIEFGDLIASYQFVSLGNRRSEIFSDLFYAPIIEDNRRGATLRSKVGGFHSIKLTRNGWQNIVAFELRRIRASGRNAPPPVAMRSRMTRDAQGRFSGTMATLEING
jgi:hypothetical protein